MLDLNLLQEMKEDRDWEEFSLDDLEEILEFALEDNED